MFTLAFRWFDLIFQLFDCFNTLSVSSFVFELPEPLVYLVFLHFQLGRQLHSLTAWRHFVTTLLKYLPQSFHLLRVFPVSSLHLFICFFLGRIAASLLKIVWIFYLVYWFEVCGFLRFSLTRLNIFLLFRFRFFEKLGTLKAGAGSQSFQNGFFSTFLITPALENFTFLLQRSGLVRRNEKIFIAASDLSFSILTWTISGERDNICKL